MNQDAIKDAIDAFKVQPHIYQREAVDVCLANPEISSDRLVAELDAWIGSDDPDSLELFPLYAFNLLSYWKDTRLHSLVLRVLLDISRFESVLGDFVTEDAGRQLCRTCGGDFSKIKELLRDDTANAYSRCAALDALQFAVAQNLLSVIEVKKEAAQVLQGLVAAFSDKTRISGSANKDLPVFGGALVVALTNLHPGDHLALIDNAFSTGAADSMTISPKVVRDTAASSVDAVLAGLSKRFPDNGDSVHQMMSWWACFQKEGANPAMPVPRPQTLRSFQNALLMPSVSTEKKKLGRNDPCFCGSGRKYKKCCLGKSSS